MSAGRTRSPVDEYIERMMYEQAARIEAEIVHTIKTSRKAVIVNTEQGVDPLWVGDREVVRSPHVPLGTAYEYDPSILDFRAGLGEWSS